MRAGDFLKLLVPPEESTDGWVFASHEGALGYVPASYVKVASATSSDAYKPMLVATDFVGESSGELSCQANELLIQFAAAEDGWCQVAPADTPGDLVASVGYVPASFLVEAPPDGVILEDFYGSGPGELPVAAKGSIVWRSLNRHQPAKEGWVFVVLEGGLRGYVPSDFVEWVSQTPSETTPRQSMPSTPAADVGAGTGVGGVSAATPAYLLKPIKVLAGLKAEAEGELSIARGELLVLLKGDEDGWCQAAAADTPGELVDGIGYVPASFVTDAPADGVVSTDFYGSSPDELQVVTQRLPLCMHALS